ncbi:MAG: hypothetical protein SFX74_00885 [Fimbriimonadaceae bacterium]|nr:hypothetical protein [Fimbriimonadaceae bacterium]
MRRVRRFGAGPVLALAVAAVATAILALSAVGYQAKHSADVDIKRMRAVFVAWQLYRADWSDSPAPTLDAVRYRLESDALLTSTRDIRPASASYPADPSVANGPARSDAKISWAYVGSHLRPGGLARSWNSVLNDPQVALLASVWHGSVTISGERVSATGPIHRVMSDGGFRTYVRGGLRDHASDPEALFLTPTRPR